MSKQFKISLRPLDDIESVEQAQENGHFSTLGTYQPDGAVQSRGPVTPVPRILATPLPDAQPANVDPGIQEQMKDYADWLVKPVGYDALRDNSEEKDSVQEATKVAKVDEKDVAIFAPFQPKLSASQTSTTKHGWAFADLIDTLTRGQAGWFQRLFSFLLVGGLGALVNLACFSGLYYFFSRSLDSFLGYVIAFTTATEVSIVCNFVLNDRITFRHLQEHHRSWLVRCVRFHVTSVGGTLLTLGISFSLLHLLHVSALLAQMIALIAATAFNFAFHHIFTYRHVPGKNEQNHRWSANRDNLAAFGSIPGAFTFDASTSKFWRQPMMKTLIIIPTYNELENLPLLLQQIFWYAPTTDVLVVDDNSPDGTGKLAEEIRKQDARVHVLHRPGKLGLGTAYIAGFKYAIEQGYNAAFEMDADFSHDPRYLPDFLKAVEQADLVIGSRYIPGGSTPNWSFIRRLISGSGNIFARFMLSIPVHDCTGGFRCYRRQVLESLDLDSVQSRGYAFQVEMTYRVLKQGFKIVETPITFMDRRLGTSKMSRKIVIEAFTYVLRTRFSKQSSVRAAALQRASHSPVTPNQGLRTEAVNAILIEDHPHIW